VESAVPIIDSLPAAKSKFLLGPRNPIGTPAKTFVVLGKEGVWLREGSIVRSGDVGANAKSTGHLFPERVEVLVGERVRFVNSASRLLGDSIVIGRGAEVFDVYYNRLHNKGKLLGRENMPLAFPVVEPLPLVPTFTPGTQNLAVPPNGTLTLVAGNYGKLLARPKATITFTGGVYTFTDWDIHTETKLYFAAPTEIRLAGGLDTDAKVYVGPAPNVSNVTAKDILIVVTGQNRRWNGLDVIPNVAKFGHTNTVKANVYVPNGARWLRAKTVATGAFIGKWVVVDEEVELILANRF